jgi:hypothetical protein
VDAPEDAGRRFHEHSGLIGEAIGHPMRRKGHRPGANQDILGKATRMEEVFLEGATHGVASLPAIMALSARNVVGDHHSLTGPEFLHSLSRGFHISHDLVAQNLALQDASRLELEEIRSAEAGYPHAEENLSRPRGWQQALLQAGSLSTQTGDHPVDP